MTARELREALKAVDAALTSAQSSWVERIYEARWIIKQALAKANGEAAP